MAVSKAKKAPKEMLRCATVANGCAEYVQIAVQRAKIVAAVWSVCPGFHPWASNELKMLEPIIMHTMKQEKIIPKGITLSLLGTSMTGVHRNTKMYLSQKLIFE